MLLDIIVLGLPRGGVPVAFEIAVALQASSDVMIVRKLGLPGHEELAMGAAATCKSSTTKTLSGMRASLRPSSWWSVAAEPQGFQLVSSFIL